jgi:hypothetical protein
VLVWRRAEQLLRGLVRLRLVVDPIAGGRLDVGGPHDQLLGLRLGRRKGRCRVLLQQHASGRRQAAGGLLAKAAHHASGVHQARARGPDHAGERSARQQQHADRKQESDEDADAQILHQRVGKAVDALSHDPAVALQVGGGPLADMPRARAETQEARGQR